MRKTTVLSLLLLLGATALFIATAWAAWTQRHALVWPLWSLGTVVMLVGFGLQAVRGK